MPLVLLPTRSTTDVVSSDAPGALKTRCSVVTCNQAGLETRCKVEAEQVWFCGYQLPTNPTTGIGWPHWDSLFLFYSDHMYDNNDLCQREKYSWQPQNNTAVHWLLQIQNFATLAIFSARYSLRYSLLDFPIFLFSMIPSFSNARMQMFDTIKDSIKEGGWKQYKSATLGTSLYRM